MSHMSKLVLLSGAALLVTACATSVNERSPEDIAQRSFPVLDSFTGLSQVRSPSIKQGGWAEGIKATAYLQTAEAYQNYDGGAWLDVGLVYDTPTANPAEMQVYNRARWAGGEQVLLADFSATVLSCEDRVQDVSPYYGAGHYGGSYYGGGGHYRRGHGGYGRRGRKGRDGRGGDGDRDDDRDDDDDRDTGTGDDDGTDVVVDRPRRPRRRPGRGDDDGTFTPDVPTNGPQPPPMVYRRAPAGVGGTDRSRRGGSRSLPTQKTAAPVSRPAPRRSVSRPATKPASKPVSRPAPKRTSKPASRPSKPAVSRRSSSNRTKGMYFQSPGQAANVSAAASSKTVSHRPYGRSGLTASYRGYNRGYYPRSAYGGGFWGGGFGATDYVVTSSCKRREQMRVYVPRDVLQRAQGGAGLTLLLRGQNGGERQVRLSPNYINGFAMARDRFKAAGSRQSAYRAGP